MSAPDAGQNRLRVGSPARLAGVVVSSLPGGYEVHFHDSYGKDTAGRAAPSCSKAHLLVPISVFGASWPNEKSNRPCRRGST